AAQKLAQEKPGQTLDATALVHEAYLRPGRGSAVCQPQRARLRGQALGWLRDDLTAWGRLLEKEPDKDRPTGLKVVRGWQQATDFAGVRGPEALARLPEPERQPWRQLWDDVAATLARARAMTIPGKKSGPK